MEADGLLPCPSELPRSSLLCGVQEMRVRVSVLKARVLIPNAQPQLAEETANTQASRRALKVLARARKPDPASMCS